MASEKNKSVIRTLVGIAIVVGAVVVIHRMMKRASTSAMKSLNTDDIAQDVDLNNVPQGAVNDMVKEALESTHEILKGSGSDQMSMTGWQSREFIDETKNPRMYIMLDGSPYGGNDGVWKENPNDFHDAIDGESNWNTNPNDLWTRAEGMYLGVAGIGGKTIYGNAEFFGLAGEDWNDSPNDLWTRADGVGRPKVKGLGGLPGVKIGTTPVGANDSGGKSGNTETGEIIKTAVQTGKENSEDKFSDINKELKSGKYIDPIYLKKKFKEEIESAMDLIRGKKEAVGNRLDKFENAASASSKPNWGMLMSLRAKQNKLAHDISNSYDKEAKMRLIGIMYELFENPVRRREILESAIKNNQEVGDVLVQSAIDLNNASLAK